MLHVIFELNSQGTCMSYVSLCSCIEQRSRATDVPVSPVEVSYLGALSFGEYSQYSIIADSSEQMKYEEAVSFTQGLKDR